MSRVRIDVHYTESGIDKYEGVEALIEYHLNKTLNLKFKQFIEYTDVLVDNFKGSECYNKIAKSIEDAINYCCIIDSLKEVNSSYEKIQVDLNDIGLYEYLLPLVPGESTELIYLCSKAGERSDKDKLLELVNHCINNSSFGSVLEYLIIVIDLKITVKDNKQK